MKPPNTSIRRRTPIIPLVVVATALAAAPAPETKPLDDVTVVVTDLTDAGREIPIPSPQHPVYYIGLNLGFRVFTGGLMAGDPPPNEDAMLRTVADVLARQGYRGEDPQHPATQIIACTWGVIGSSGHTLTGPGAGFHFLGGDKLPHLVDSEAMQWHASPETLLRDFSGSHGGTIVEMSHDTLYVVLLSGFDLAAHEQGKVVKLWETRLACSSPGNSLARSLPRLVVSGQFAIGRETLKPVVGNLARTRQAWAEIGESTVIDFLTPEELEQARQAPTPIPEPEPPPPSAPDTPEAK